MPAHPLDVLETRSSFWATYALLDKITLRLRVFFFPIFYPHLYPILRVFLPPFLPPPSFPPFSCPHLHHPYPSSCLPPSFPSSPPSLFPIFLPTPSPPLSVFVSSSLPPFPSPSFPPFSCPHLHHPYPSSCLPPLPSSPPLFFHFPTHTFTTPIRLRVFPPFLPPPSFPPFSCPHLHPLSVFVSSSLPSSPPPPLFLFSYPHLHHPYPSSCLPPSLPSPPPSFPHFPAHTFTTPIRLRVFLPPFLPLPPLFFLFSYPHLHHPYPSSCLPPSPFPPPLFPHFPAHTFTTPIRLRVFLPPSFPPPSFPHFPAHTFTTPIRLRVFLPLPSPPPLFPHFPAHTFTAPVPHRQPSSDPERPSDNSVISDHFHVQHLHVISCERHRRPISVKAVSHSNLTLAVCSSKGVDLERKATILTVSARLAKELERELWTLPRRRSICMVAQ
ncbi:hypothetical protein C7M84_017971 [Penaeus vannamei]|uniref:Uncharacterized protein n=1 Tax=Penaeus vannamei TaxID=6689 RepID=A0A423SIR5_PENVA|nr:hypothetical protein C7M84_017971 [Penaeus vannamei]